MGRYKYQRNSYAFHKMNDDAAYWLGFLYTDGSVIGNRIQLKLKDIESVEAFKQFTKYEGPIAIVTQHKNGNTYTHYQICIHDHIMSRKLIELGCVQRKTYSLKFPKKNQLDPKYYASFIRGVFDGDGSIFRSKTIIIIEITGTQDFLTGIQNVFIKNKIISNNHSYIYKAHSKNQCIKRLSIGNKESVQKIYTFLYDDHHKYFLERKKNRFMKLLNEKKG